MQNLPTNHTQILNWLIERRNLKSYLELGVQSTAQNFDKIKLPLNQKHGVDPELPHLGYISSKTSDDFFDIINNGGAVVYNVNKENEVEHKKWDLIFLDGFHEQSQVKRDFENSLRCLNDNGYIVIHDTCPDEEQYTIIPRQTKKWFGDVYKFAMQLNQYDGINFITFDMDCGCTVVWEGERTVPPMLTSIFDWSTYKAIGKVLLNVVDPETFFK